MPSIGEVRKRVSKSPHQARLDPWLARLVVRRFSFLVTWLLLHTGLRPNAVTVLGFLVTLAGSVLLWSTQSTLVWAGVGVLFFGFVLDNVDGEVARFRGEQTLTGAYLDTVGHILLSPIIHYSVAIGVFRLDGQLWILVAGFLGAFLYAPIPTYALQHEIVSQLGRANAATAIGPERQRLGRPSRLYVLWDRLKNTYGAPWISYPDNIVFLAGALVLNSAVPGGRAGDWRLILVVYWATVCCLRLVGSLANNVNTRKLERELERLTAGTTTESSH